MWVIAATSRGDAKFMSLVSFRSLIEIVFQMPHIDPAVARFEIPGRH